MGLNIVITGVTGMVGEGVLLECLQNKNIDKILSVSRKPAEWKHPKLQELMVTDFMQLDAFREQFKGFDACFYCAGISSVGLNEDQYTKITYDITLHMAGELKEMNPDLIFNFVSGGHTDSSEQGKVMWARVKGRTENALSKLFPGREYNFRPGLMKPVKEQKHVKGNNKYIKVLFPLLNLFFPSCDIRDIGKAMINATINGYSKNILEVKDIKELAAKGS
ncbi:NAD-dependent epimerase/dehydratase family protein [Chitinophaga sp. S165]|uniref:NAD-dependent epimerase/dehydratase family protein n=1 Tax=Chitinophaga sp. S165 TaxID=2135462 RepID=UPI000D70E6DD|nr:NAD-dependent epimerase/dehydratase family protein [Chitinophaga sp. S165]PWV54322.1 NAD-dependent epimerase/dehydratase family protein [Chitinophaga sp. S165]